MYLLVKVGARVLVLDAVGVGEGAGRDLVGVVAVWGSGRKGGGGGNEDGGGESDLKENNDQLRRSEPKKFVAQTTFSQRV